MIKIAIVSVLVLIIKAQSDQEELRGAILGPYHHIAIQIFDDDDTLVPPILNVNEGANLTLNCRTFHLLYHPGQNYYDEDIIWSRSQNWRLQKMHQKSIQNIQKNAKLTFETVTLEDQGRYICTSLKYHTSRILYIIVQSKNRTEQYFRRKRDLIQTTTATSKRDSNDSENALSVMLGKGSFQRRVHLIFIMTALAIITLTLIVMVAVRMCKKCTGLRKRNRTLSNVYIIPVADLPYTRLYEVY